MSTTFEHDPAFPYLVVWGEYASAKFAAGESGLENAHSYAEETVGKVIDTTPIKEGVYTYRTGRPEDLIILKYRGRTWRDADGYELANQNVDVNNLVRLVPES